MDGLGWDETQVVTNSSSPLWIHNPEENNILVSNNSNFCSYGGKMDLATVDIFDQIQELQKAPTSQVLVNSKAAQEGTTENWRNSSNHQEIYSTALSINNKACFGNMNADHQHHLQARVNAKQDGVSVTASLDSLDCLLSASNSNTDTSIEDDDGISMLFSYCRALWNNLTTTNNTSTTTASSGESENNITCDVRNKETHDETASQSSSDQAKRLQPKSEFPTKRNHSFMKGGFELISETNNNPGGKSKKLKQEKRPGSSNISFQQPSNSSGLSSIDEPDPDAIAQMKEMIYRAAAFRPVNLGLEMVEKPKRKNVRISTDPQTVAARQRRERISERIRVLQRLVPGGSKMDTASMLDEAANYLKFLRSQVKALQNLGHTHSSSPTTNFAFSSLPFNHSFPTQHTQFPFLQNPNHLHLP